MKNNLGLTEIEVHHAQNDDDEYDGVSLGVEAGQPAQWSYAMHLNQRHRYFVTLAEWRKQQ